MGNKNYLDWLLRFIKGIFIGSGFILPGVSGGVLAVVFGMYERLISFFSNLTKDFKKNFLFFFPVGLGVMFGIFLFSSLLYYSFQKSETELLWFFIGCIVGTLPALFNEGSKKGRKPIHIIIMVVSGIISLIFLRNINAFVSGSVPLNFLTWIAAGFLIALGSIVPGLSPSNFLVILNMYKPMTDGISSLDFMVIIPIGLGAIITVVSLSKFMSFIFKKAFAVLFHIIIGIVFASTIMIIPMPTGYNYLSFNGLICAAACILGICLGLLMSKLEKNTKTNSRTL